MHLTKRQSQALAALVLILFFGVVFVLTSVKKQIGSIPSIEFTKDESGKTQARVVFGEFNKSETKDGKKLWEVKATTGRYYPEKNLAELENALVWIYKNDDVVHLSSKNATVHLTQTSLQGVEAVGNVIIHSDQRNTTLKTEKAIYDKDKDSFVCPGHVEIESAEGIITGESLIGDTSNKNFTIEREVETRIKAREEVKKNSAILSNKKPTIQNDKNTSKPNASKNKKKIDAKKSTQPAKKQGTQTKGKEKTTANKAASKKGAVSKKGSKP